MPLPTVVARFSRDVINPITRHFAGRVPPFAIVEHRGRKSGARYRTPMMAFPREGGFVLALTYGPETDWVRNVQAAGGCTLEYGRRRIDLTDPELRRGAAGSAALPAPVRFILRLLRVDDFLWLRRAQG
jgi:deazaflavin-dependent oxidoreductase (nitroreductase family)